MAPKTRCLILLNACVLNTSLPLSPPHLLFGRDWVERGAIWEIRRGGFSPRAPKQVTAYCIWKIWHVYHQNVVFYCKCIEKWEIRWNIEFRLKNQLNVLYLIVNLQKKSTNDIEFKKYNKIKLKNKILWTQQLSNFFTLYVEVNIVAILQFTGKAFWKQCVWIRCLEEMTEERFKVSVEGHRQGLWLHHLRHMLLPYLHRI